MGELYITGTGQSVYVHERYHCGKGPCPIHFPTKHSMLDFPTHWRDDRKIMERVCPHGVGHPDPDCRNAQLDTVHGCDGCCQEERESNP